MLTRKKWNIVKEMTLLNVQVRHNAGSSVLKKEINDWSKSFEKLMASTLGQQIFTRFLEHEYSDENMMFWHACEDYKHETRNVKREIMAKEIYFMFLSPEAPLEINIDSKTRTNLNAKIEKNPSKDVFNEAQEQVYLLMERDCFLRFVNSDVYQEFLKTTEDDAHRSNDYLMPF